MEEMKQPLEQENEPELTAQDITGIPAAPEAPKKKKNIGVLIGIICSSLLVCAAIALSILSYPKINAMITNLFQTGLVSMGEVQPTPDVPDTPVNPEDDVPSHVDEEEIKSRVSYGYTDASLAEKYNAQIVATVGDNKLSGAMFQIFFWSSVYNYLNTNSDYVAYLGPDVSKPLSEQDYGEDVTWEQHFVEAALELYLQNVALQTEAINAGTPLSEESQANLDSMETSLTAQATEYGFATVNDYLAQSFGPNVTLEDYKEYCQISSMAYAQADLLQTDIDVTDDEVEAFYDANAEAFAQNGVEKTDQHVVNVRHILVQPEQDLDSDGDLTNDASSEEAWAAAEKSANEIYENWKLDPTEENFGAKAAECTFDTASAENGGLYENVYPGQMVAAFNDWCFDAARKPGDTDIVKTDYGYHIMYFVSVGDTVYWRVQAKAECQYEKFDQMLQDIFANYELKTNYDSLHIYDILAVNAAASAASGQAEGEAASGQAEGEATPAE